MRVVCCLLDLAAEAAALSEAGLATGGLAQHSGASTAEHDRRRVGEDGGDLEASGALHIHEEAVGALYQALQLVLLGLELGRRVEQVVIDRHVEKVASTVMPIERAEPAMIRTAASMSAAVRSGCLVFAISSA